MSDGTSPPKLLPPLQLSINTESDSGSDAKPAPKKNRWGAVKKHVQDINEHKEKKTYSVKDILSTMSKSFQNRAWTPKPSSEAPKAFFRAHSRVVKRASIDANSKEKRSSQKLPVDRTKSLDLGLDAASDLRNALKENLLSNPVKYSEELQEEVARLDDSDSESDWSNSSSDDEKGFMMDKMTTDELDRRKVAQKNRDIMGSLGNVKANDSSKRDLAAVVRINPPTFVFHVCFLSQRFFHSLQQGMGGHHVKHGHSEHGHHHVPSLPKILYSGFITGLLIAIFSSVFGVILFPPATDTYDNFQTQQAGTVLAISSNLLCALLVCLFFFFFSPSALDIGGPDMKPAVFVAKCVTQIRDSLKEENPEKILPTVLFTIISCTLLTGSAYFLLGKFKLTKYASSFKYTPVFRHIALLVYPCSTLFPLALCWFSPGTCNFCPGVWWPGFLPLSVF